MSNAKKIIEYANPNNGGRERIILRSGKIAVSSDWGEGFCAPRNIGVSDLRRALAWTCAPDSVVQSVLEALS